LSKFCHSYERYGFNRVDGGIMYREWIPAATYVSVFGDFSELHNASRFRFLKETTTNR
jgi:1,4-alpha-glucan branching enzyme